MVSLFICVEADKKKTVGNSRTNYKRKEKEQGPIMSFTSVPILDLAQSRDPATKPRFLTELRHALMEVGFLYLKNVGIPDDLWRDVIREGRAFFDIPREEKYVIFKLSPRCFTNRGFRYIKQRGDEGIVEGAINFSFVCLFSLLPPLVKISFHAFSTQL